MFGPVSECAIMISQLDPMITACNHPYYREKEKSIKMDIKKTDFYEKSIKISSFICKSCKKLITNKICINVNEQGCTFILLS